MCADARIPEPIGWGSSAVEPFVDYYKRWPKQFAAVPELVVESWIYRHWQDFQAWLPLRPLNWKYEMQSLDCNAILQIRHVRRWPETLARWGDDLLEGRDRRETWLGRTMLEAGTTPTPMIVAHGAGRYRHPREGNEPFCEPYQLIEGHLRIAYLQGMIRHGHPCVQTHHDVFLATLPK